MQFYRLIISLLSIVTIFSCSTDDLFCTNGNGAKIERVYSFEKFEEVILNFDAEVIIQQADTHTVAIVASDNIIPKISLRVIANTLLIDLEGDNSCINEQNGIIKIYVTAKNYKGLSVSGAGSYTNVLPIVVNELELNIDGSGTMDFKDFWLDKYDIFINGSGVIDIVGDTVKNGFVLVSGSGDINLKQLPTSDMIVKVNGSGAVFTNPIDTLNTIISGSGDVFYIGTPFLKTTISGNGSLIKQ